MTDNWWSNNIFTCPVCETDECVPASGPKKSPILVVAEFPGRDEVKKGKPLVGATGHVFQSELAHVGIDMKGLRLCNLWHHAPNKNEECLAYGVEQVIKEAKGRKLIVLVGSETVKYFCDMSVAQTTGLVLESKYFSIPVFSLIQPAIVFHAGGVGELRLSLQKLGKYAEENSIL